MPGKGYWIYTFWLVSIVIVGIGGFWLGDTEASPKFLASIEEALSSVFSDSNREFVEVLDVKDYPQELDVEEVRKIETLNSEEVVLVHQLESPAKTCVLDMDTDSNIGDVIINEIAWMGGLESQDLSYTDEWIELKNISPASVDISGWQIKDDKGDIDIVFPQKTTISPGGFLLLERGDDNSVPGVIADLIYSGTLTNEDEVLWLISDDCEVMDVVIADPRWPSGDSTNRRTMERSDDLGWHTFSGAVGEGVLGTPKAPNSNKINEEEAETSIGTIKSTNFNQCMDTDSQPTHEVLINEVSWAGKADNTSEEWIELYNPRKSRSLEGWQLLNGNRSIMIVFGEEDRIDDYYLLRRILESEDPNGEWRVGDELVDHTYTGVIKNSDEKLQLFNKECVLVDEVENVGTNWNNIGGSASPEYRTAERTNGDEWHTYSDNSVSGIMGTPRSQNSAPSKETQLTTPPSGGGSGGSSTESIEEQTCSQDDLNEPTRTVLINEVAWSGNASSTSDEWIELYTDIDRGLSLSNWQLLDKNGEIKISLNGRIDNYLLLKRILVSESPNDIYTVGTIPADITFTGTINNDEETLRLFDASCNLVDEVIDVGTSWTNIGGSASPDYRSAERIDINTWGTYEGEDEIMGTPREQNSLIPEPEEEEEDDEGGEEDPGGDDGGGEEEPTPEEPGVIIDLDITNVIYDAEGADEGQERIVIQNNSTSTVDISNFSIQYLKTGTEYTSISKKNFEAGHQIDGGGEFIVGANCSGAVPCDGVNMSWSQALGNDSGTIYLVSNQEAVVSSEDIDIVDSFSY